VDSPTPSDRRVKRFATATTAFCGLLVATTLAYPFVRARIGWAAAPTGYAVGDTIDLPAAAFRGAPHTLVVFVRASCAVCQQMTPLLTTILSRVSEHPSMRVLLVTPATDGDAEHAFADEIGIAREQRVALDLTLLRVTRVPTVVVVNERGKIEYVHIGKPSSAEREAELVGTVTSFALER